MNSIGCSPSTYMKKRTALMALLVVMILTVSAACLSGSVSGEEQPTILMEMESEDIEYDDHSLMIVDTSPSEVKTISNAIGASYELYFNGRIATLTLPGDLTVSDVCSDERYSKYIGKFSLNQICCIDISEFSEAERYYTMSEAFDCVNLKNTWKTTKGDGVTVAVLDTGLSSTISGFDSNLDGRSCDIITGKTVAQYGRTVLEDQINHGTISASIIARDATSGFIGMAPECNLLMVKIANGRYIETEDIVSGIEYAVNAGTDVINMSFGGGYNYSVAYALSLAEEENIVCVGSSGNSSTYYRMYPAALDTVVSVGSIDYYKKLSTFSNFGFNDVVAPGEFLVSSGDTAHCGTSFSGPMVTGSVVLYLSVHSESSPADVRSCLFASAENNGLNRDCEFGCGILDVDTFVLGTTGTITYDLMTEGMDDVTQIFYYGKTSGNTYIPTSTDATFLYWYEDDQDTPAMPYNHVFKKDVTLHAMWSEGSTSFVFEYANDGELLVKKYIGDDSEVTIPSYVQSLKVVGVSPMAFEGCTSIRELVVPGTIEYIGIYAFSGCTGMEEILFEPGYFTYDYGTFNYGSFFLGTEDDPVECKVYGLTSGSLDTSDNEYTVFDYRDRLDVYLSDSLAYIGSGYAAVNIEMPVNTGLQSMTVTVGFNSDYMYPSNYECTGNELQITYDYCITEAGYTTFNGTFDTIEFVLRNGIQPGLYPLTFTVSDIDMKNGYTCDSYFSSGILYVIGDPGDLNGDKKIDSRDALLLKKYLAKYDVELVNSGDVNGDGDVNIADSLTLRQYLSGMNVSLVPSMEPNDALISVFGNYYGSDVTGDLFIQCDEQPCITRDLEQVLPEYCIGSTYRISIEDAALIVVGTYPHSAGTTRTITYNLNGGTADPSSPATYTEGSKTDLGCPVLEGKMFLGWYLDEGFTQNLLYISDSTSGDLTLYAKWGDDPAGLGYTIEMTGKFYETLQTYDATASDAVSILGCDSDYGYLLQENMTYKIPNMIYSRTAQGWQNDSYYTVTDNGIKSISIDGWSLEAHHKTYVSQGQKIDVYLIYGWLPVSVIYEYTGDGYSYKLSGNCERIYSVDVPEKRTVTVYSQPGVNVEYSDTVSFGGYVRLSASCDKGTTFDGWYYNNYCLATTPNLIIGPVYSDLTVFAFSDKVSDITAKYGETITVESGLSDVTWNVMGEYLTRSYVGTSLEFECTEDCRITYTGMDSEGKIVNKVLYVTVDESKSATVVRDYSWEYDGKQYSLSLSIKATDILEYRNYEDRYNKQNAEHALEFVTYNDQYVKKVSDYILKSTKGMSDYERLMVLMRFVQTAVPYAYDYNSMGITEYWKFPLETLFDANGDCEDTAILFCAVGKAMGYDVALMIFYDHVAGAISIETFGFTERYNIETCTLDSKNYYYLLTYAGTRIDYAYRADSGDYYMFCETTSPFNIGESWYFGALKPQYDYYSSYNVEAVIPVV